MRPHNKNLHVHASSIKISPFHQKGGWPHTVTVLLLLLTNQLSGERNSRDGCYTYCHTISQNEIMFPSPLQFVKVHCPTAINAIIRSSHSGAADE